MMLISLWRARFDRCGRPRCDVAARLAAAADPRGRGVRRNHDGSVGDDSSVSRREASLSRSFSFARAR